MSTKRKIVFAALAVLVVGAVLRFALPDYFAVGKPLVSVKAEEVFRIGGFVVTNSVLLTLIVTIMLIALAAAATGKLRRGDEQALREPRGLQNVMEATIEALYNVMAGVSPKFVGRFFVIVATIFLLVLPSNWFGLIPGVGSLGVCFSPAELDHGGGDHAGEPLQLASLAPMAVPSERTVAAVEGDLSAYSNSCARNNVSETDPENARTIFHPFLRPGSADLNLTLALALISFVVTEFWGFKSLGLGYLRKFFNFSGGPIGFFVGIVELISEFARIVSFTFRLFGNIFAGEVVLLVMAFLFPVLLSLPFYGLEVFVGFIQAFVFAMLTMAFIDLAAESHDDHGEHAH